MKARIEVTLPSHVDIRLWSDVLKTKLLESLPFSFCAFFSSLIPVSWSDTSHDVEWLLDLSQTAEETESQVSLGVNQCGSVDFSEAMTISITPEFNPYSVAKWFKASGASLAEMVCACRFFSLWLWSLVHITGDRRQEHDFHFSLCS